MSPHETGKQRQLNENNIASSPFRQFTLWFEEAVAAKIPDVNAMTLATGTPGGKVSARVVLLKQFDETGFCFFTNYESAKGMMIAENPNVALVFFWQPLERQVRIEGVANKMTAAEADAYFHTRPVESQIGALASPQSRVIENRSVLEKRFQELAAQYQGATVPRPEHWGGYRVAPHTIEFWQGRASRLHDRIVYRKTRQGGWTAERLAP